jgi:hypothetical protein
MQVLLMAAMSVANLAVTTTTELDWSDHYANAKVQAAAEHRPLLVVLEDSANPQGRFDQQALASQDSQVELLHNFRLCRMDVTTDYGKRVAAAFGAKQFPFTAITDNSAQYITFQAGGTMSPEQWNQTLATRKDGNLGNPAPQRVETSKVITDWPVDATYSAPSYCPNCVRRYR